MYSAVVSHDIDSITKYKTFRNILGAVKRKNNIYSSIKEFRQTKKDRKNDPYYNMEEMLEINNSFSIPTVFYFMTGKTNPKFDPVDYSVSDKDIKNTISSLLNNGAIIGLHPSYESYNNLSIIKDEKKRLEDVLGFKVEYTRQHYLRHDENTFALLLEAGLKYDSTVGPRDSISFNDSFNNDYIIAEKDDEKLYEQPFLFMDTHLLNEPEKLLQQLNEKVAILRENKGTARIIWHNNNYEKDDQKSIYKEVLSIIAP